MATKEQQIMEPLGKLLRNAARNIKLPLGSGLGELLSEIQSGNVEAFKDLPKEMRSAVSSMIADMLEENYGATLKVSAAAEAFRNNRFDAGLEALVEASREGYLPVDRAVVANPLYGQDFFARDPLTVAEELCGSSLVYMKGVGDTWGGVVTETAAYAATKKDMHIASAEPGTIGAWPSQGHYILIISAHRPGNASTVAVWGVGQHDERLSMGKVGSVLEITDYEQRVIGKDAPYLVHPRDTSSSSVGRMTVKDEGRKKGAIKAYRLVR